MFIEKDKLPKNHSYALKTSMLVDLLEENDLPMPVSLDYCHFDIFFEANYVPAHDVASNSRLRIRVGSVASNRCREARDYLQDTVLPQFAQWMKERNTLPSGSTRQFGPDNTRFLRDFA